MVLGPADFTFVSAIVSYSLATMPLRFVNPNFHVIIIHYPLGVFVMGVILELLGFMWPKSSLRTAARWMILLGALCAIPAATSGIYALSDVANHQSPIVGVRYHQLYWHVVLQGIATLLAVGVAAFGLAASDRWRRKAYLPILIGLLAAWGFFVVGSWHGGETVYDKGTAVRSLPSTETPPNGAASDTDARPLVPLHSKKAIRYYLGDIVQIHMIVAGCAFAVAIGALALSIRKITSSYPDTGEGVVPREESDPSGLSHDDAALVRSFDSEASPAPVDETVYPAGRFWLLSALIVLATAAGGFWMWADNEGTWSPGAFWKDIMMEGNNLVMTRASVHVWVGIAILLLTLILACMARWATQRALGLTIFAVLILLAMAAQIWLGVLLQFDNGDGSLFHFNRTSTKESRHQESRLDISPPHDVIAAK